MRDLIDFFPLHLDLKASLAVFPSADYKYALKHGGQAFNYFEFRSAVLDGSETARAVNFYHKNAIIAEVYRDRELKLLYEVELTEDYLEKAKDGTGVIVVEGNNLTELPLILQIIRKQDSTKVAQIELPTRIVNVEDMYRHVNLRANAIYPGSGGLPTKTVEPPEYSDDLTNGKYVTYVHGYNISGEKARGSQSNIFKRLHQLGNKARYIGVYWHGDPVNPGINIVPPAPDYHRAVYNGLYTSQSLKINLSFTQDSELTVLAHSLGNSVVSNAIANHGLKVKQYYMINCAMPIEAYDSAQTSHTSGDADMKHNMTEDDWKPYQPRLYSANWHELFSDEPSDNRNKLTWKDLFNKPELLSVTYNFYSPTDHVVENADDTEEFGHLNNLWYSATDGGRHAWVSQEIGKGGQNLLAVPSFHDNNGGWEFSTFHMKPGPIRLSPEEASLLTDDQLKEEPFHLKLLYPDLYDPDNGSAAAGPTIKRYELLATGIPAMSFAVAVNPLPKLEIVNPGETRNFNMPAAMKNEYAVWPTHSFQKNPEDWLHGDFKDVSFQYLYPMYQKMIDLGNLDEN